MKNEELKIIEIFFCSRIIRDDGVTVDKFYNPKTKKYFSYKAGRTKLFSGWVYEMLIDKAGEIFMPQRLYCNHNSELKLTESLKDKWAFEHQSNLDLKSKIDSQKRVDKLEYLLPELQPIIERMKKLNLRDKIDFAQRVRNYLIHGN